MLSKYVVAALAIALLSSCSSRAKNVETDDASTSLSCEQLNERAKSVSSQAITATGKRHQVTGAEAVLRTVFWLEIKLLESDDASSGDVARLKAEMIAIERASDARNCGIEFGRESLAPKKVS